MFDSITAYIGLGSNLSQPVEQLKRARLAIANLTDVEELNFSSFYSSPPMGPQDQPDYINAVMGININLPAIKLLRALQTIENIQGRVRKRHWGERTLDLDILVYGDKEINEPDLIIPHKGISERSFVLYPLQEIAPDLIIPKLGSIADLVKHCPKAGLEKLT